MLFYGLNKEDIKSSSKVLDNFYVYNVGASVEVTSLKKKHVNEILAKNLSSNVKEDRLMVKYYPSNEIYFNKSLIDSNISNNFSSYCISKEFGRVYVGEGKDYSINSGILALSGILSLNGLVEKERLILCNSQMRKYVREKVKVLACGVRGDKLLALYYIPSERGLALSCDSGGMGISAKSLMIKNYDAWDFFSLENWFEGVQIKEYGS